MMLSEIIQEYNVLKDEYIRVSNDNEVTKGWQNGAAEFQNVAKKQEYDWNMVYLAREGWLIPFIYF